MVYNYKLDKIYLENTDKILKNYTDNDRDNIFEIVYRISYNFNKKYTRALVYNAIKNMVCFLMLHKVK